MVSMSFFLYTVVVVVVAGVVVVVVAGVVAVVVVVVEVQVVGKQKHLKPCATLNARTRHGGLLLFGSPLVA